MKLKTKSNPEEYSMVVSNITEVGWFHNPVASFRWRYTKESTRLSWTRQKWNISRFYSLSCNASDGIYATFIRGTSISQIKMDRPAALSNMFKARTETKSSYMLQQFYETMRLDGVFGCIFFLCCPNISDLSIAETKYLKNATSLPHLA